MTALASCSDFLTEDVQTGIPEEEVFSDINLVEQNLVTIYNNARGNYCGNNFELLSCGTDETQHGAWKAMHEGAETGSLDYGGSGMHPMNSFISGIWNGDVTQIAQLSKIIRYMDPEGENASARSPQSDRLYGESCFLRGALAMEMVMLYGPIPVHDHRVNPELKMDRKPLDVCWKYILDDLEEAARFAPESNSPQRATRYAALMMLGRAYMSAPESLGLRNWERAAECLKEVCESPNYQLVDNYGDLFDCMITNTRESIFEWQFSPSDAPNSLQWLCGSRTAQAMIPNEGEGCLFAGYDNVLPTPFAYSYEDNGGLWEQGDARYEVSLRTDFTHNGVTATPYNSDGTKFWTLESLGEEDYDELDPHIKKYEDPRNDVHAEEIFGVPSSNRNSMYYSAKNICWLRLADAYLLYAECLNEVNRQSEALQWVNKVRKRGFNNDLPAAKEWKSMDKETFRDRILDERMRELMGERWRKFDLLRTGKLLRLVNERNKWANRFGSLDEHNLLLPVPYDELTQNEDLNPETDQNPGY